MSGRLSAPIRRFMRYRGFWRWSPLLVIAVGHMVDIDGPHGRVIRFMCTMTAFALVGGLELRDHKAAIKGKLRLVPQCNHNEDWVAAQKEIASLRELAELNRDTIAALQRAWARIGVTEPPEHLRLIHSDGDGQARGYRDTI